MATPARNGPAATGPHLVIVKDRPPRHAQSDGEILLKCKRVLAMVAAGYLTPAEAWPFLAEALGGP